MGKLHMTMLVIFRSLVLAKDQQPSPGLDVAASPITVAPAEVGNCLARLHQFLKSDLKLELFFPGCHATAAPFVLFRLKREGFSACTAIATPEGLLVRANR